MSNVVHEYFKKEFKEFTILVQVNPVEFKGVELIIHKSGKIEKRSLAFDENIYEDLEVDGFRKSSPLEFNLFIKGLTK